MERSKQAEDPTQFLSFILNLKTIRSQSLLENEIPPTTSRAELFQKTLDTTTFRRHYNYTL